MCINFKLRITGVKKRCSKTDCQYLTVQRKVTPLSETLLQLRKKITFYFENLAPKITKKNTKIVVSCRISGQERKFASAMKSQLIGFGTVVLL